MTSSGGPGIQLSQIWLYPLKSAAGLRLQSAEVGPTGLVHDRSWMVVDGRGVFVSQREEPRLALIRTALDASTLLLDAPGVGPLALPLAHGAGPVAEAHVWGEAVDAVWEGEAARAWITRYLGRDAAVVRFAQGAERPVEPDFARPGDRVAFADGYPFLLVGEASLDDLNARLDVRLPMNRFRPNLVVRGAPPFAEDGWRAVRIGHVGFRVAKPCGRCVTTTVDQATAEVGKEPLRTLATFRRLPGGDAGEVLFGMNLLHDATGTLTEGDDVTVVEGA